ncbi:MAG TPA: radical SAM protein [Leptospiraceae bacterium]|nr:radical SAM protein [Leptospiraceae bacterium]HMW03948.1 radical SAM protein [Leptospiraceae bacterium]HMX33586.1 radical SAM protein [Leptospiraceae bacterium]HMY29928.1 radical SAM protein [Leptospiraceae bacterium]HMZ67107.1 radical SAM protein [Leptospiraceae bacterium]
MENKVSNLARRIQNHLKNLRSISKEKRELFSADRPVCTEIRRASLDQNLTDKLIIFLRGTGCSAIDQNGGCTFCGFYTATNHGIKLNRENFLNQLQYAFEVHKKEINQFRIISLYNDGSMLSEHEINLDVTLEMIESLSKFENLKLITIESKLQDITEDKILKLKNATNKKLEISFGFESSDPMIRRLCINKNFTNDKVVSTIQNLISHDVNPTSLIMVKPPFLTEREAIDDVVKSLVFLENTQVDRIDIELPTVEEFTLTHELWEKGLYQPIMLWSAIEILRQKDLLNLKKQIYISPPNYTVQALAYSSNCPKCDDKISKLFMEYNKKNDFSVFENLKCECKSEWNQRFKLSEIEILPIVDRVEKIMNLLENKPTF